MPPTTLDPNLAATGATLRSVYRIVLIRANPELRLRVQDSARERLSRVNDPEGWELGDTYRPRAWRVKPVSEVRIGVVGAGPAGLTAAIAGRKLGLEGTVFERARTSSTWGSGSL